MSAGGRSKDTIVYSLSATGAFLETPRATIRGADVDLEIRLPSSTIATLARVVFSNVPGNLQRPTAPVGMGVHFLQMPAEASRVLRAYVEERTAMLAV